MAEADARIIGEPLMLLNPERPEEHAFGVLRHSPTHDRLQPGRDQMSGAVVIAEHCPGRGELGCLSDVADLATRQYHNLVDIPAAISPATSGHGEQVSPGVRRRRCAPQLAEHITHRIVERWHSKLTLGHP